MMAMRTSLMLPLLVTDAMWMDINEDDFPDLMVVGEWIPIKIFLIQRGKTVDPSAKYIKFPSTGWWNTLYADDMDMDGDLDVIIGNCELNTQFRSGAQQPVTLYYHDFDQNGSVDLILCYYNNGVSYPAASRDD